MGLEWSAPKKVKANSLLVLDAGFPEELRDRLWKLYREKKEELRKDGFLVGKFSGHWKISYFHRISPTSFQRNAEGVENWELEFQEKLSLWKSEIPSQNSDAAEKFLEELQVSGFSEEKN